MDSISQFALGAAIGGAVLGRRFGRKALVWGGVCGTLPDLDIFIPMGDPVSDFTYHRAASHSLFFLTLAAPLVAALMTRLHGDLRGHYRDCLLMAWLALVTHPLLDCFTVYGTQILLPFSDYPVTWSTIFIIDPLYTIPLVVAVVAAWAWSAGQRPRTACVAGLWVSSAYLLGTVLLKVHVNRVTAATLAEEKIVASRFLTTPAPFNTLLWRIVVMQEEGYLEGFYSVFDGESAIEFAAYRSDPELLEPIAHSWAVRRLEWFTKGFYRVRQEGQGVAMTDLRMGVEPWYVFSFRVGERLGGEIRAVDVKQLPPVQVNLDRLAWIWDRIWDRAVPATVLAPAGPGAERQLEGAAGEAP